MSIKIKDCLGRQLSMSLEDSIELSGKIDEVLSQELLKNIIVEKDNIIRPAKLSDMPDNFINMCIVDYLLDMQYSDISKADLMAPDGGKIKVIFKEVE